LYAYKEACREVVKITVFAVKSITSKNGLHSLLSTGWPQERIGAWFHQSN